MNPHQCEDSDGVNFWNTSTEGNYWSDWTGPDNDSNGIVDFPYVLDGGAGAKDYYPIASSGGKYKPHLPIRINSDADFDAQFPGRVISGFDINGTGGFCIYIGNCSAPFKVENNYLHNATGRFVQYFFNTGIYLYNSSNAAVSNNYCSENGNYGIYIEQYSCSNTLMYSNCSENGDIGIYIEYGSNGNTLNGNTCYKNRLYGIKVSGSDDNMLTGNICSEHTQYGIYLEYSDNNTLTGNTWLKNTERGTYITSNSKHNCLHHNNFIYNNGGGTQAYDGDGSNFWNTSTEGNYWDDWTGPDSNSDGIVDIPYSLAGGTGEKDYYPLTTPGGGNDTIPPTVKINSPADGSHVPNTFTINVTASDNVAVDRIDMYVNGSKIISNIGSSFEQSWTIPSNGIYVLEAVAYDTSNNFASDSVTIYVNMSAADTEKPYAKITSPANGTTISGFVDINATISDNVQVAIATLFINGIPCFNATNATGSFAYGWVPAVNGTYFIEVTARDTSNNTASDSIIVHVNLCAPYLHHAAIVPGGATLVIGNMTDFTAIAYDNCNNVLSSASYSWSLSSAVGTLNSTTGKTVTFTATSPGSANLTVLASSNGGTRNASVLILVLPLSNQTFSVMGNVTSSDDRVLVGINVTLDSLDGSVHRLAVTNSTGGYAFAGLLPGKTYIISVNITGYEPYRSPSLTSVAGKDIIHNIKIKRNTPMISYPIVLVLGGLLLIIAVVSAVMFVVPAFYTRIRREKVLDHFVRGQVFDHIRKNPGTHYNAMKSDLRITNGTLGYHLRTLERQGFIKSKREGILKRFYEVGVNPEPGSGIQYSEVQLTILESVSESPGICQTELSEKLGIPLSVISYNSHVLKKVGAIRMERGRFGKKMCYIIDDSARHAS